MMTEEQITEAQTYLHDRSRMLDPHVQKPYFNDLVMKLCMQAQLAIELTDDLRKIKEGAK